SKDAFEVSIRFLENARYALHGGIVLAPDFHDPVFVALGRDSDRAVGTKQQIGTVIAGEELVHFFLRGNLYQRLRVSQKSSIATDGARQEDAAVFGDAIGDEGSVECFLRAIDPD